MEELVTFLNQHKFTTVVINNHESFRDRKYESDPNHHDCGYIDGNTCLGCRACVFSTCEIMHNFLIYLIDDLKWSDKQLTKYFNLSYVNIERHRNKYPGGCHVKRDNEYVECDFHKMFIFDEQYIQKLILIV